MLLLLGLHVIWIFIVWEFLICCLCCWAVYIDFNDASRLALDFLTDSNLCLTLPKSSFVLVAFYAVPRSTLFHINRSSLVEVTFLVFVFSLFF